MKQEIISAFADLKTRSARSGLISALVDGGVLSQQEKDASVGTGSLGTGVRDTLKRKDEALFRTEKSRQAYRLYLRQLEAQLKACRFKDKVLLGLLTLGFLCSLAVIGWGIRNGLTVKDVRLWVSVIPTAAVGVWNRINAKLIHDLTHDLHLLAKAD